jgi:threonine aldolase
MTVISSILRPYQGVICVRTGHINVHETGAIEHSGHKVLALEGKDGLLSAESVREAMLEHINEDGPEHTVQPGMVYISFSTEVGTVYTLKQLEELAAVCREYGLPLFIDGARMGYGLASEGCDVTLQDIARLADVFYIGGTKQGALFGEAVVITNPDLKKDFRYSIKQNGGMLAKGRLLGIQFLTLFEDGLYFELSRHAVALAMRIRNAFAAKGYDFLVDSPTNQQFPILPDEELKRLAADFQFSVWKKIDDRHTAVRFCTSWATRPEAVDALLAAL